MSVVCRLNEVCPDAGDCWCEELSFFLMCNVEVQEQSYYIFSVLDVLWREQILWKQDTFDSDLRKNQHPNCNWSNFVFLSLPKLVVVITANITQKMII